MEVRRINRFEDVEAAGHLFDGAPRQEATRRFLADERHHLLIAYVEGAPVGMVTGVEMTHPDKGTEMFLYELGVDESYQGRGIGRELTSALARVARERECYGMWVVTELENAAALATYRSAGGSLQGDQVLLEWNFGQAQPDV